MKFQDILPSLAEADPTLRTLTISDAHIFPQYVTEGDLFISLPSRSSGLEKIKIDRAIEGGAKVVIKQKTVDYKFPPHVHGIDVLDPRHIVAEMASHVAPAQPKVIAGITGTSGKTSTALFINQIWRYLGIESAYMGSLGVIPPSGEKIKLTRASQASGKTRILHYYLDELAKMGITHVATEMTSSALEQCRGDYVRFKAAAFTNLSFEHLNYHKTMEAYFVAKTKLFNELLEPGSLAVINQDDAYAERLIQICKKRNHTIIQFGSTGGEIRIQSIKPFSDYSEINLMLFGKRHQVVLPVAGMFQGQNLLTALGITIGLGGEIQNNLESISTLKPVVGRWEKIATLPNSASIYLDFAHKPAALEMILKEARSLVGKDNKITVIFGCDGNADPQKRPLMGSIAARFADNVIITDDNVRKADPAQIRAEIQRLCPHAYEIPDREQAIKFAISQLNPGDIGVIIAKLDNYDPTQQDTRPLFGTEEREIINRNISECLG